MSELYYDPYDFEIDNDPHPIWKRMRDEAPLYRNDRYDFWALSRYADVEAAHRDHATFSSAHGTVLELMSEQPMGGGFMIFLCDPADRVGAAALDAEVNGLLANLPGRAEHPAVVERVNDLSRLYPRPFMWLLLGIAATLWRRPRGLAVPAVLAASALVVMVVTSLAVYAVAEYSVPVVPAFVLLATAGLFGRRAVAGDDGPRV